MITVPLSIPSESWETSPASSGPNALCKAFLIRPAAWPSSPRTWRKWMRSARKWRAISATSTASLTSLRIRAATADIATSMLRPTLRATGTKTCKSVPATATLPTKNVLPQPSNSFAELLERNRSRFAFERRYFHGLNGHGEVGCIHVSAWKVGDQAQGVVDALRKLHALLLQAPCIDCGHPAQKKRVGNDAFRSKYL